MLWPRDAEGWPHRDWSRIVENAPHRWHVQEAGDGPTLLFLHGAGASTHSWRDLLSDLARDHHVVAIDLPGQGFTRSGAQWRSGLDDTAEDIAALAASEGWRPAATIGHSAGGAIALRLQLCDSYPSGRLVCINPALATFRGLEGIVFPRVARAVAALPFAADLVSLGAGSSPVLRRLADGTGSRLSPEGLALYRRLATDRDHIAGTLAMMAQWSLDDLTAALPRINGPALFLLGDGDRTVPPETARRLARQMPVAQVIDIPDLGHLLHEERPLEVSELIRTFLDGATP